MTPVPFHQQVAEPLEAILVAVRPDLVEQRSHAYPNEAVGIICADATHYPLINQARSPKRFEVSQLLVTEAIDSLKAAGRHPIAVYHTHPESSSDPSKRDEMLMSEMPQATSIIVGSDGIAAWMWDEQLRFITRIPLKETA